MAENSLFAILLRSPWWISFAVGIALALAMVALLPSEWKYYAAFMAVPLFVIAAIAGWRQLRAPSRARVEETLAAIRAMSSSQFADVIEKRLRTDGYEVTRIDRGEADFVARRASRTTLVSCKRFKIVRAGIKPLQELHDAMQAREADDAIYVAAGEVTEQAKQFAGRTRIRVIQGAELAAWLPAARPGRLRAA